MTGPIPPWEQRFRAPTRTFPSWSRHAPDRVVFASNEDGAYQVYVADLATGQQRRSSDVRIGVEDGTITADGAKAVWFQDDTGDESGRWLAAPIEGGEATPLMASLQAGWPAGVALGRHVIAVGRSDRLGYQIVASVDGAEPTVMDRSREAMILGGSRGSLWRPGVNLGALSADETLLCIEHADRGDEMRRALRVLDLSGSVVGELWDGDGRGLDAVAWSPIEGDQRLAIRHERSDRGRPAIWDLRSGERRDLDLDLPGDVFPMDWWPDARTLLLLHRHEGRDELYRLDLEGELSRIAHPTGTISDARVRPSGEVWLGISSGGVAPRTLSDSGAVILPVATEPPGGVGFEPWTFVNPSGDRLHGFVASPPGGGPFPVLLYVHGGPTGEDADEWEPSVQAFVDHGFAVGMVNYRGSTGYGMAWRDRLIGDIGLPEEEDVAAGLDDLVARGLADPERAVIGGWSWGGYVTLLSIGRTTDRWRAAIGGVPVGDYVACYDQLSPDLQAYDRYLLGGHTPHELPDLMAERSPIVYADRVRTPTIVLAGKNDSRCPYEQAIAWVNAVKAHGGPVEVYEYDTGHVSNDPDEVVRQMWTILGFLSRHVGSVPPSG